MDDAVYSPPRRPRILILEPSAGIAELVAEVLASIGCEVAGACGTLEEAEIFCSSGAAIDGAVLEMSVWGSFSFELAERLREQGKAVIFFSRHGAYMLPESLRTSTVLPKPAGIEWLGGAATTAFFGN